MSFKEFVHNIQNLDLGITLPFQTALKEFADQYLQTLDGDDLEGLTFSADIGMEVQEITFGSGEEDFLTMEFTQINGKTASRIAISEIVQHLNLQLNAHQFVNALLHFLAERGAFHSDLLDGTIYTCFWSARDQQQSIALFIQTSLENDIRRITPLF